jgi:hypothetical protein
MKGRFDKLKVVQANNLIGYLEGEIIVEITDSVTMNKRGERNNEDEMENLLNQESNRVKLNGKSIKEARMDALNKKKSSNRIKKFVRDHSL